MTYLSPCDHDAAQKQEEKRSAYSWRVLLEYYDHKWTQHTVSPKNN